MHIFEGKQTREEYFTTQIERSKKKFIYCKVSVDCVMHWKEIVKRSCGNNINGPLLCLGTRNGREVDLFRAIFFGNKLQELIVKVSEKRIYAFSSRFPLLESFGRSNVQKINAKSVIGVELNPEGKRIDVLTASFDELPSVWAGKFNIVFSNCLDHAQDPYKTAKEWFRVLAPGGHIILSYPGETVDATLADPVGKITLEDVRTLFPGEPIYFNKVGNVFQDVIIKK
jgi:SAM-dependent methyltransferase